VGLNRDKDWAYTRNTPNSISAISVVIPASSSSNGTVVAALRDNKVSEVVQRKGSLWIGSVETPYVGLFKFASLTHA
jgi:hypothetical protein